MSRVCDAFKCCTTVAPGRFLCSKHWRLVPTTIQRTINERYRAGRKDFAFLSDVVYLQACVHAIEHIARMEGHDLGGNVGEVSAYDRLLRIAKARANQGGAAR